ncbi:MAG: D-2-hydroxyacid dehydrogenase [Muribaculaceae bacterium]|nr:D-2-hydroxyacid dehydrogenase [Muribaculaceae bacterium]
MKIVVLDGYSVNPGDMNWDSLAALGDLTVYDRTAPDEVIGRVGDAAVVITNKVPLTGDMLRQMPDLKYVGILATGYNIIDLDVARELGIVVTNIPAYSTDSVAQMVFAHLLNIVQRIDLYTDEIRAGEWCRCADFCFMKFPHMELAGKTIGIVGFGNIGRAVARIAAAFGMKVVTPTSKPASLLPEYVEKVTMQELFRRSDVVSLHCPLTPQTRHLINADTLSQMKSTAILINTGRGPLVDDRALADALNNGIIHAAGLDVLTAEPPGEDNPLLTARNCWFTPHIGWATVEARRRLLDIAVENFRSFLAGTPVNNVAATSNR